MQTFCRLRGTPYVFRATRHGSVSTPCLAMHAQSISSVWVTETLPILICTGGGWTGFAFWITITAGAGALASILHTGAQLEKGRRYLRPVFVSILCCAVCGAASIGWAGECYLSVVDFFDSRGNVSLSWNPEVDPGLKQKSSF
jgi:hypothetical protein